MANSRKYRYRTPARSLWEGLTIMREDGRLVKIEKMYALGQSIFIRDDSGTPGALYSPDHLFDVMSDN